MGKKEVATACRSFFSEEEGKYAERGEVLEEEEEEEKWEEGEEEGGD